MQKKMQRPPCDGCPVVADKAFAKECKGDIEGIQTGARKYKNILLVSKDTSVTQEIKRHTDQLRLNLKVVATSEEAKAVIKKEGKTLNLVVLHYTSVDGCLELLQSIKQQMPSLDVATIHGELPWLRILFQ